MVWPSFGFFCLCRILTRQKYKTLPGICNCDGQFCWYSLPSKLCWHPCCPCRCCCAVYGWYRFECTLWLLLPPVELAPLPNPRGKLGTWKRIQLNLLYLYKSTTFLNSIKHDICLVSNNCLKLLHNYDAVQCLRYIWYRWHFENLKYSIVRWSVIFFCSFSVSSGSKQNWTQKPCCLVVNIKG